MAKKLNELKNRIAALKEEMSQSGQEAMLETFREFFAENPLIAAIKWQQYTPYFNDGDVCVFRVRDFYFKPVEGLKVPEKVYVDRDGFLNSDSSFSGDFKTMGEAVWNLYVEVVDKDLFLPVFGDHVEVVATPEGIDVHEYLHD